MSTQLGAPTSPTIDTAIDLALFHRELEAIEECKCESSHRDTFSHCSIRVVARCIPRCAEPSVNWCANRLTEHEADIASDQYVCETCDEPIDECWRIVAI